MKRQDRQGARTPAQLERKYNHKKMHEEAMEAVDELDKKLDQDSIFNRLTNNGKSQGIYRADNGDIYLNASYLVTGILKSQDGSTFYLDLVNGILKAQFTELSISGKTVEEKAQDTLNAQTQEEAYNKLTNNGEAQGIFYRDGELFINASYIVGAAPTGILQSVYPVGAIYISTVATNPKTLFGFGTWVQIKDKFLLASGDTYSAGSTGGEAEHTLTVNEMPSHNHDIAKGSISEDSTISFTQYSAYQSEGSITAGTYWNATTNNRGGSQPHNNMPPYLTVYVWQRTA